MSVCCVVVCACCVSSISFSIINVLVWINDDANVTDGRHAYIYIYSMMSVFVCVTRTILSYSNLFSLHLSSSFYIICSVS